MIQRVSISERDRHLIKAGVALAFKYLARVRLRKWEVGIFMREAMRQAELLRRIPIRKARRELKRRATA